LKLTDKQKEARKLLNSDATHSMLYGGGRSGKTAIIVRNIATRAIKAPYSRHTINRFRFNACKASIALETFPKVMQLAFPNQKYEINRTDWVAYFENGSEVWFNGLDDKERTEKLLGKEYATIYNNECSQIPFSSRNTVLTRLAQKIIDIDGNILKVREYNDCNPPSKNHWTYKLFIRHIDPDTGIAIANPSDYVAMQMNPVDNVENISESYLDILKSQGARYQRRFMLGEFADANPNALFNEVDIDKWRVMDASLPDMVRVVVAVDPSGSGDEDNADNDAIGIVVVGLGTDGNGYVLEDCTVKAGPNTWGNIATSAFDRHKADIVVAEINYGGEMVRHVIQTARPRTPFKKLTASRGKAVRAEPISSLYEVGKVRHVGIFTELEEELCGFSTVGYTGEKSPNRADALIWGLTELFPGLVNERKKVSVSLSTPGGGSWMSR
jgi:Phage terminase large subunit/Terminase RNaseH-like domain